MKRSSLFAAVLLAALPAFAGHALAAGDAVKGKKIFNKCKICHNVDKEKNKIGPHLVGLFGRHAASVESYTKYSKAMKSYDTVWSKETLTPYLTNPKATVPGTKMAFPGIKNPEQLQDLLAYLEEATKKPQ